MQEVYTLADLRGWPVNPADEAFPVRLAVLGDPIAHSASPPMQNTALAAVSFPFRYVRLHVHAEELPEALGLLPTAGFIGANLTLPHKTAALPLVRSLDASARDLGAINTLRVEADGTLRGFNTDGPGFVRAVKQDLNKELRGARVLVFGAGGGAGRALAAQCAQEGCRQLLLVNRTIGKAEGLAGDLRQRFGADVRTVLWEHAALAAVLPEVDLVVNASSLGLRSGDDFPLPGNSLSPTSSVFDTVYHRDGAPTPLLEAARKAGVPAVGGLSLLLHQGALAFEIWFGQPAPLEVMRQALTNH